MIDRIFFPAFSACLLTVAALAGVSALQGEGAPQPAAMAAVPSTAVVQLPRVVITAKRSVALATIVRNETADVGVAARNE